MNTVVKIENISKKYIIQHQQQEKYVDLRDVLTNKFWNIGKQIKNVYTKSESHLKLVNEEFWALRDINLNIKQGERFGIIGRNGAGKSTLLKILSRITEPTSGRITIKGKVSSLLEVGTGFHPELTAKENIYLNGAILGMNRKEINNKFDEIVAFAEIEKFLDTPVKRYSSGMYMRLAFAVAAHLEPDILIVDEVLAVGDMAFQKKCLGKMEDVSHKEGRTVIFVSHNMSSINSLCSRCILLENGQLITEGRPSDVTMEYYSTGGSISPAFIDYSKSEKKVGDEHAELLSASIESISGDIIHEITLNNPIYIKMRYRILKKIDYPIVPNIFVQSSDGNYVFWVNAKDVTIMNPGEYEACCEIPPFLFNEGTYFFGLGITIYQKGIDFSPVWERSALCLVVIDPMDEYSNRYGFAGPIPGPIRPSFNWTIGKIT